MVEDASQPDDAFDRLLADYDEQLAHCSTPLEVDSSTLGKDAQVLKQWQSAKACLELLDRVRRRWTPADCQDETPRWGVDASSDTDRAEPATLGRFRIAHRLGQGGLGIVYLAYDPKLGRQVALKVPRFEALATSELRRRFLREGEAAARLSHRNLVTVYEAGEEDSICYIAAEYCPGLTLADWLKQRPGKVPIERAALMTEQLAEAVQHAHGRGVLHRDIKPSNVLLANHDWSASQGPEERARDASEGRNQNAGPRLSEKDADRRGDLLPKLTDFGMAKLLQETGDETRSGALIGTPAYMAPEQAEGRVHDLDTRTDVYGLGAVLYELLTGRRPHEGPTDVDILRRVVFEEPTAPRRLRAEIPRDLEAICLKCLAKRNAQRYATAQELADDLRRFLSGLPTAARPLTSAARMAKWCRRRPAWAALWGLALAAGLSLLGVVVGYNARLQAEIARAHAEGEKSRQLLYSADVRLAQEAMLANNLPQTIDLLDRHVPQPGQEDLRDFAWHHLRSLCDRQALTLRGHESEIFGLAYSPDGSKLATASKDGTARLWDAATGQELRVLRGHTSEVTRVAFSPDGRWLATTSEDRTIRLWDTATGEPRGVLEGHTDHVMAVDFSTSGRWLATGGRDKSVRIWNVEERTLAHRLDGHADVVMAVAFSPDDQLLVSGDESGAIQVWRTDDWQPALGANNPGESVLSIAYSRDLPWLACAGKSDTIQVWDWDGGGLRSVRLIPSGHTDKIQCLAFSPLDNSLASASKDGMIRVHSIGEPEHARTILGHVGRVWCVAWSPDGRSLASAGADGVAKIWNRSTLAAPTTAFPRTHPGAMTMDVSADGATLVTGCSDGYARIWDTASGRLRALYKLHEGSVGCLRLSPAGNLVASSGKDCIARVWNLETGEVRYALPSKVHEGNSLAWSPDGDQLAASLHEGGVVVVDVESGRLLKRLDFGSWVYDLEFAAHGGGLATGDRLATVASHARIHDARSGQVLHTLGEADRVAMSPDGCLLATSRFGTVTLWDARAGRLLRTFVKQEHEIQDIAFSPDGRTLATMPSEPAVLTLWDVRTGQELLVLTCENGRQLTESKFSPEGDRLFAAGVDADSRGRIWHWTMRDKPPTMNEKDRSPRVEQKAPLLAAEDAFPIREEPQFLVTFDPKIDGKANSTALRVRYLPAHGTGQEAGGPGSASSVGFHASSVVLRRVPRYSASRRIDTIAQPYALELLDLDRDGDLDVVAVSGGLWNVYPFLNDASGGFRGLAEAKGGIQFGRDIKAGDLNGDDALDVVFVSHLNSNVCWLPNRGDGSLDDRQQVIDRQINGPEKIALADLDLDGDLDVVGASGDANRIWAVMNVEQGQFALEGRTISVDVHQPVAVAVADLDGDGDPDVLSGSLGDSKLAWYANDGTGQFGAQNMITTAATGVENVTASDLDGDGDVDVVYGGADTVAWFANDGNGTFSEARRIATGLYLPVSLSVVDADGDGDLDIIVGEYRGDRVAVYVNEGGGGFARAARDVHPLARGCLSIKAGDINGDGRPDVVIAERAANRITWTAHEGLAFDVLPGESAAPSPDPRHPAAHALRITRPREADVARRVPATETVLLRFESLEGHPLTTADVAALIASIHIYQDANRNGAPDPDADPLVASVDSIALEDGILTVPIESSAPAAANPGIDGPASRRRTFAELVRAINAWSRRHGYAGGYPTFAGGSTSFDSTTGDVPVCQAVLFRPAQAKRVMVAAGVLDQSIGMPYSDFDDQPHLIRDLTSRLNRWAWSKGYRGALPGYRVEVDGGHDEMAYETLLLKTVSGETLDLTLRDLDYPASVEELFRAVHRRAAKEGYLSAYPAFVMSGTAMHCVPISSKAGELVEIPLVELR